MLDVGYVANALGMGITTTMNAAGFYGAATTGSGLFGKADHAHP
jgi:hypothetical protein